MNSVTEQRSLNCFPRLWPRWVMPVALWRTGLLLSFLTFCSCLEEDCVLGIVGQPVSLPCLYPELLRVKNFSIEWRRGDEVVLRSAWGGERNVERNVEEWSVNSAAVSADAPQTGNFSLELPTVDPKEHNMDYHLFITLGENQSVLLCNVCLSVAASFSSPLLQREETHGEEVAYICQSGGGFPEPAVYWLINYTEEPPEGSVSTLTAPHPVTHLYNITSHLRVSDANITGVSCIIENQLKNETLASTSYGARSSAAKRASEAMWIFSVALCVVVGVMVVAAVAYQIHLDKISKRKSKEYQNSNRGYRRRCENKVETEAMKTESKETDPE